MTDTNTSEVLEATKELGRKLDAFMALVPATYITRIEASTQHTNMGEKIQDVKNAIDTIEEKYRQDFMWNNQEHKSLSSAMIDSERRIIARIEENATQSWGSKLTIMAGAFGWILTLALVILDFLVKK